MGYSSGILKYRVTILNKQVSGTFGETTAYQRAATVWADVTWSKGVKSLREGALDAYDTVIIRMRYNQIVTRDSLLVYDDRTYQIQSFHRDQRENIVQITAVEMVQPPTLLPNDILLDVNGVALMDADGVYLTAET